MSVRTYEKGVFRNSVASKDKDGSNRSSNASLVSASGFSRKGKKAIGKQRSEHYTIGELKEEETDQEQSEMVEDSNRKKKEPNPDEMPIKIEHLPSEDVQSKPDCIDDDSVETRIKISDNNAQGIDELL